MSTRTTRPTGISGAGSASDDRWDEPTRNDSTHDTAPHDLIGVARAAAAVDTATAFNEGVEEAIRAFYVVMRRKRLTRPEMDNIVLLLRAEITRL